MAEEKKKVTKIEYTKGKVAHAYLHSGPIRIYAKPSLGKDIVRKSGVARKSDKVRAINEKVKAYKPAKYCKGVAAEKGYDAFRKCLKEQMLIALGKLSAATAE